MNALWHEVRKANGEQGGSGTCIDHSIGIYLLDFLPEACVSFVNEEIKSAGIAFPTIKELLHP